jgi:hypothetical protein
MATVVERNKTKTKSHDVCHSHDFCDANMAMDTAMKKLGMSTDLNDDTVLALVNAAWELAKKHNFKG